MGAIFFPIVTDIAMAERCLSAILQTKLKL